MPANDKTYRNSPVGALMDEYERVTEDLKNVLKVIDQQNYDAVVDPLTKDPDCISIKRIMNHVVGAGYGYSNLIRKLFGESFAQRKESYEVDTPQAACRELDDMLAYTVVTLENKWDVNLDDLENKIIKASWGQNYDFEQMLEHAIVHILRHRRQIEKFNVQ